MFGWGAQFDDAPGRMKFNRLSGVDQMAGVGVTTKVNAAGSTREHPTDEVRKYVNEALWEEVAVTSGHRSYESLRNELSKY